MATLGSMVILPLTTKARNPSICNRDIGVNSQVTFDKDDVTLPVLTTQGLGTMESARLVVKVLHISTGFIIQQVAGEPIIALEWDHSHPSAKYW